MPTGSSDRSYAVGYGKPPVEHRFKPKHSKSQGPRKRKTKLVSIEDLIAAEYLEPITVSVAGKKKRISKIAAVIKQNMQRALSGDEKASATAIALAKAYMPKKPEAEGDEDELSADELAILQDVLKMKALFAGEGGDA